MQDLIPSFYKSECERFSASALADFAEACQRELNDREQETWGARKDYVEYVVNVGLILFDIFVRFAQRDLVSAKGSDIEKAQVVATLFGWWEAPCAAVMKKIEACDRHFKIDPALRKRFVDAWKDSVGLAVRPDELQASRDAIAAGNYFDLRKFVNDADRGQSK